jgi:TRAP-type C4-dicarboxylate transport system permease small subunit
LNTKKPLFSINLARDIMLVFAGAFFPVVMQALQYFGSPSNWKNARLLLEGWVVIALAIVLMFLIFRSVNNIYDVSKKKENIEDDERDRKLKIAIKEIIINELASNQNK